MWYQVEELRKIQCVAELPTLLDAEELKHFFGLASYYWRFVKETVYIIDCTQTKTFIVKTYIDRQLVLQLTICHVVCAVILPSWNIRLLLHVRVDNG